VLILDTSFFYVDSPHASPTSKKMVVDVDWIAEMKYIIAVLYSNYSTTIVDDAGIEQIDSYTAPPKSDKLLVRLEKMV
jgi:hypothetical protein